MKTQELEHLSKDEIISLLCDFYNEVDKNFYDNIQRSDNKFFIIMTMYENYIQSSRKLLHQIKK